MGQQVTQRVGFRIRLPFRKLLIFCRRQRRRHRSNTVSAWASGSPLLRALFLHIEELTQRLNIIAFRQAGFGFAFREVAGGEIVPA